MAVVVVVPGTKPRDPRLYGSCECGCVLNCLKSDATTAAMYNGPVIACPTCGLLIVLHEKPNEPRTKRPV